MILKVHELYESSKKRKINFNDDDDFEIDVFDEDLLNLNMNSRKWKSVTNKLIRFIVCTYQPISLVDNEFFDDFIKALNPKYKIPCRQTVNGKLIPQMAETIKNKIKLNLQKIEKVFNFNFLFVYFLSLVQNA